MSNAVGILALGLAAQGGGGGGGEPAAYIKSASVANNELTLTRKDDTTLTYSPDVDKAYVDSAIEDVEAEIPSLDGYATEQYVNNHHDSTKQDTLTAGTNISIVNNVISASGGGSEVSGTNDGTNWTSITIDDDTYAIPSGGGSEPSAYLKSASVSNNTLTLVNKDNTTVSFTPDTGSEVSVSATGTATDEVQYITIDGVEKKLAGGGGGSINGITNGTGNNSLIFGNNNAIKTATADDSIVAGALGTKLLSTSQISATGSGAFAIGYMQGSSTMMSDSDARIIAQGKGSISSGYIESSNDSLGKARIYAKGNGSYALGNSGGGEIIANSGATIAFGHASGSYAESIYAGGNGSIAVGDSNSYRGIYTDGTASFARGYVSNAQYGIAAKGNGSHAEGYVSGLNSGTSSNPLINSKDAASYARGYISGNTDTNGNITAAGKCSTAIGIGVTATDNYSVALGKWQDNTNTSFAINVGNGVDNTNRGNAFTLDWSGNGVFAGTVTPTGADYCEYFEWKDSNPDNEDRMGYLVTLDENKLVLADADDDIIGITTKTKSIIGDSAEMNWDGKYLKDELGGDIYEDYDIVHEEGTDNEWVEHIHTRKINPEWDPDRPYTPRSKRKEWYPVGLLGKLYVRDDGTAVVNGYVTANSGIATNSAEKTNLRVLQRVNDHIIRVLVK